MWLYFEKTTRRDFLFIAAPKLNAHCCASYATKGGIVFQTSLRPVQSSVFLSFLWLNQFLWLLQNPIVFWAKLLGRCLDCGDHPPTLIQPQSSKLSDIMLDLHKVSYNLTCNEIITIFFSDVLLHEIIRHIRCNINQYIGVNFNTVPSWSSWC